jgi:hypothetical protein
METFANMSAITSLLLAVILSSGFGYELYLNSLAVAALARPDMGQQRLSQVRKIYVGDMGTADESERFRHLLEDQLNAKGFTVVDDAAAADAILTGALSVRVLDDESEARVYVTLRTPGGERIWSRDFGNRFLHNPFNRKEPVKLRAEDVANGLKRAAQK